MFELASAIRPRCLSTRWTLFVPVDETTAGPTAAVGAEPADAEPPELVAVSVTIRVWPLSAATGTYVFAPAPAIGAQAAPARLQRLH
jgi:hypothetical protein